MPGKVEREVTCKKCGAPRSPDDTGPCPKCGEMAKAFKITLWESIAFTSSVGWTKRREFLKKNKVATAALFLFTFAPPIVGYLVPGWGGLAVGSVFGLVAWLIGPYTATKVVEIERRS